MALNLDRSTAGFFGIGWLIDLFVIIQFGTKISVVAKNTIDSVKYQVETQTGLKVSTVNLNIEGIKVQS